MLFNISSKIYTLLIIATTITSLPTHLYSAKQSQKNNTTVNSAEIAAVVNEEMISINDLKNRARFFAATSGQAYSESFYQRVAPQILEALINESLQRQHAKIYKINIGAEEIKNGISQLEKMNSKEEGFLKHLCEEFKIPYEIIENQTEANIAWEIISREMFRTTLQVSKNEIDSYIKQLEANKDNPHLHLAEIFVAVDRPEQEPKARQKVNEIGRYLRQGAHFSILAQQFSDSPTKAQGGDIGWISETELDGEIKSTILSVKVNEFSNPIRTKDGYKIIYIIDRKDTSPEAAAQIIYTYKRVNFPVSMNADESELFETFQKASSVAENAKSCEMLESLAKTAGNAQIKEVGGVSAGDIPPPVLGILNKLDACKEGEVSQKCRSSTPIRSEIGILLFMTCKHEKIEAGKIDRTQIENRIANMKLQNLMGREMRNLRRAAHIVNKLDDTIGAMKVAQKSD